MSRFSNSPMFLMAFLMLIMPLSGCMSMISDDSSTDDSDMEWIDPVIEIEDENHSHNDLLAHRLSTILNSENIYVIDTGKVVANGKHEELMKIQIFIKIFMRNKFKNRHVLYLSNFIIINNFDISFNYNN